MDERKKRRIQKIAEQTLKSESHYEVGFDIYNLLSSLNIKTYFKPLGTRIYGASRVDENGRYISINSENGPARQRFSAAHELGHILLHQDSTLNYSDRLMYSTVMYRDAHSATGMDEKEVEANYFAACLLMPEKLVVNEIIASDFRVDENDIDNLAEKFKVSSIAMSIRLAGMGFR